MRQRGILDRVTSTDLGTGVAVAAAVGATWLEVDWTGEFDDAGTLLLNDSQYPYTRPDDTESMLMLGEPLAEAVDEGDVVLALDPNGQVQTLVQAWVRLDEGEDPLPFKRLSDTEGFITEDTPTGTGIVVDLAQGKVLGLDSTPADYTGQTAQIDPETGEQTGAVTPMGDAQVNDLTSTGTIFTSPESVDLGGYSLSEQIMSQPAGRLRGLARGFGSPLTVGTSYVPLYSMDLPLNDDRSIDFGHEALFDSTGTSVPYVLDCFHTWSATEQPAAATTADELFYSLPSMTAPVAGSPRFAPPGPARSLAAGFHRFTWAAKVTGSGTVRAQGVHRVLFTDQGPSIFEDAGYWDGNDGGAGESADPQQFTTTWSAVATQWYNGDANNTPRSDGANQYFGRVSTQPQEGNRKSAIWFPTSQIRAALAGATVSKVELYIYLFSAAGGSSTVVIGSHNSTSLGERWENINGKFPDKTRVANFNDGTGKWVSLGGSAWNLNNWASLYGGIVVGPGPDSSNLYAGGYKGMGSGSLVPKLRITYVR